MVIDFHTHIFPEKIALKTIRSLEERSGDTASTDGTVNGLLSHMEASGVTLSVALPVLTKPTQFESVFSFAKSVNETYFNNNSGILSFAGIHPDCEDIDKKMLEIKKAGFKGVKIHPDYQAKFFDDKGYIQILNSANEYDLIVVTHAGVDDGYKDQPVRCTVPLIKKVLKEVKPKKLVLGHFGAHRLWNDVYNELAGENVFFDTAVTLHRIDKQLFLDIVKKHGSEKVLFATDCPWANMSKFLDLFSSFPLSENEKENILYKNALKLLDL